MSEPDQNIAKSNDNHTISPLDWLKTLAISLLMILLGGYATGWLIEQVGAVGSIGVWGLGFTAGSVARLVGIQPSRLIGWTLVIAVILTAFVAEICWIRWNIIGADSWTLAAGMIPQFIQEAKTESFIMALFAGFGAYSAYSQVKPTVTPGNPASAAN